MGELNDGRWALMSERGCEALGLTYAEALELGRKLKAEKVSGLCVITEAAGRRLRPAPKPPTGGGKGRTRRDAKGRKA